jgi:peptidoglycan/LPS O-acetylase OafA/YrhL
MDLAGLIWHVAGLLAPALFVPAGLAALLWPFDKRKPPARILLARIAINFIVCAVVLLAGLALTGHDGRMTTYAALALTCAAVQAWQTRR